MNNFKGGGAKRGGGKFGNKSKFGGGKHSGGGGKFGGGKGRDDRGGRPSGKSFEKFKANCSECHSSCEVPFRPSGDKPVYCSDCFSKRSSDDARGDTRGGHSDRPSHTKPPRDQRSPRHDPSRGQSDFTLSKMQKQLTTLEEKLNRILDIINPPMPSPKVVAAEVTEPKPSKKERRAKKEKKVVVQADLNKAIKKAVKKTTAKKVAKKTTKKATKKVTKKVVKKVTKTTKKAAAKKTKK